MNLHALLRITYALMCILLLAAQAHATVVYQADHNNGQLPSGVFPSGESHLCCSYSANVVTSPAIGSYAARFELHDTDPMLGGGTRTQFGFWPGYFSQTIQAGVNFGGITPNHCNPCPDDWFSVSIYFPTDFATDATGGGHNELYFQWHNPTDDGEAARSPNLSLNTTGDGKLIWHLVYSAEALQLSNNGTPVRVWEEPIPKGQWVRFVGRAKWAYDNRGQLEIWRQTGTGAPVRIVSRLNAPNCYNDQGRIHMQWGIYKWLWNFDGTTTLSSRVIYLDEIKLGDQNSSVTEMLAGGSSGGGGGGGTTPPNITTTTLSAGTVGQAYNQTVVATGGATPLAWSVFSNPTGWSLHAVDSEETSGSDGRAINAFDGSTSTIWHTQWQAAAPAPPHDIQINLGSAKAMSGFIYVPRQDGSPNGRIGQYEFYVSSNGSTWGSPVASGTFANTAADKEVTFTPTTAQYVRLRAITEVNGNPWTSAAEIRLLGTLPAGLSLNTSTGAITGTPTVAGSYLFTMRVIDASGVTDTQTVSLTINAGAPPPPSNPPVITTTTVPNGTVGTAYSQTITVSGGTAPLTWSVSAGTLPPGLTMNQNSTLTGTPTVAGTYTFTLQAQDSVGLADTQAYSTTITGPSGGGGGGAGTTDGQETVCDQPYVRFCDNFEARPLGTLQKFVHTYKNDGWDHNGGGAIFKGNLYPPNPVVTNTQFFDGSKSLQIHVDPSTDGEGNGGATAMAFYDGRVGSTDVYFRWYERWDSGYGTNDYPIGGQKNGGATYKGRQYGWNMFPHQPSAPFFFGYYTGAGGVIPFNSQGTVGTVCQGSTGNEGQPGSANICQGGANAVDLPIPDQWVCLEVHTKQNTTASSTDGAFEGWINGNLVASFTGLTTDTINTVADDRKFTGFDFSGSMNCAGGSTGSPPFCSPANSSNDHPALNKWIDNIVIATQRIGCLGSTPPPPDTIPPTQVLGASATATSTSTIVISWTANPVADGVTTYSVERGTNGAGPFTPLGSSTTTGFSDIGLTESTQYFYRVAAQDAAGNIGPYSAVVNATTQAADTERQTLDMDDFARANTSNPHDIGSEWDPGYTDPYGSPNEWTIVNQRLRVEALGTASAETFNGIATPDDQWGQITLAEWNTSTTVIRIAAILVRASNPGTLTGYGCYIWRANGAITAQILEFGTGSVVVLAQNTTISAVTGDKYRCEAQGTTLRLIRIQGTTETLVLSATDSTYTSGKVGLRGYVGAGGDPSYMELDDFLVGGWGEADATPSATELIVTTTGYTATVEGTYTTCRANTANGDTVYTLASGLCEENTSRPWLASDDWICLYFRDANGVENPVGTCAPTDAFVISDTTPPTMSNPLPVGVTLASGTTSVNISVQTDEPATCRFDTTDIVYGSMTNTMTAGPTGLTHSATVSGLEDDTAYTRYSRCADSEGNATATSQSHTFTVEAAPPSDDTPPTTVTGLVGTVDSASQITYLWTAATDASGIDRYRFYHCPVVVTDPDEGTAVSNCESASEILIAEPTTTTYVWTGLTPATTYSVAVKAVDTFGNVSADFSNIATVTTLSLGGTGTDPIPPTPPSGITTQTTTAASAVFSFTVGTDQGSGVARTNIYRCTGTDCEDFVQIGSVLGGGTVFVDITTAPDTTYRYKSATVDNAGNISQETTPVEVTMPAAVRSRFRF